MLTNDTIFGFVNTLDIHLHNLKNNPSIINFNKIKYLLDKIKREAEEMIIKYEGE